METFLFLCALTLYVGLLLITSISPRRSSLSNFELTRRKKDSVDVHLDELRKKHYDDVSAVIQVVSGVLVVFFVVVLVAAFGWIFGSIVAFIGVLEYVAIARTPTLRRWVQKLYDRNERRILEFIHRYERWFIILRGSTATPLQTIDCTLDSREELIHLITESDGILSKIEKQQLESSLAFGSLRVADKMTPRTVVETVNKNEFLGPLVLNDLHKTGHSRFPVIDDDIDHVVGVLHLRDLFSLKEKKSAKAQTVMKTPVYYIKDTQTLQHALAAFLRTHNLLFIVVNEYRETVGVITLEDVLEALLGRKIMDEFDAHGDLRTVASRNPKGNNQPKNHQDV